MKKFTILFSFIFAISTLSAQQNSKEELQRYTRRAQTAYKEGEFKDALVEYKMALEVAPRFFELYKAIGDVYEKLGGTTNLDTAMSYYKRYLQLSPNADDNQIIQERIYDLEYWIRKSAERDAILDNLCGIWVAADNLQIVKKKKKRDKFSFCIPNKTNNYSFQSDFIFDFSEIRTKGLYEVTILPTSRYYSESVITETVHIAIQQDASFNFSIENREVYIPNQSKNNFLRLGANELGNAIGGKAGGLFADAMNVGIDVMQENDIPTVTHTGYTFALKYREGKLEGLVHVVKSFESSKKQKTSINNIQVINFVKTNQENGGTVFNEEMRKVIENKPDVIFFSKKTFMKKSTTKNQTFVGERMFKTDKWGNKLSNADIKNKLTKINPQWARCYQSAGNLKATGITMTIAGALIVGAVATPVAIFSYDEVAGYVLWGIGGGMFIAGIPMWSIGSKRTIRIINAYNNQISYQPKCNPVAELNLGITSSGGIGLALKF